MELEVTSTTTTTEKERNNFTAHDMEQEFTNRLIRMENEGYSVFYKDDSAVIMVKKSTNHFGTDIDQSIWMELRK